jgi:hypothetical protein
MLFRHRQANHVHFILIRLGLDPAFMVLRRSRVHCRFSEKDGKSGVVFVLINDNECRQTPKGNPYLCGASRQLSTLSLLHCSMQP